jgi:hypothetical protein
MKEWLNFLKKYLPPTDSPNILLIDSIKASDWLPENNEEFEQIICDATPSILDVLGFVRYNFLPYREQQQEMRTLLREGFELFLFPARWQSVIPDRIFVISIFAKVLYFKPGQTEETTVAGCLSYGIPIRVY